MSKNLAVLTLRVHEPLLLKEASGEASQAQFHASTDMWEWTAGVDATYAEFVEDMHGGKGSEEVFGKAIHDVSLHFEARNL